VNDNQFREKEKEIIEDEEGLNNLVGFFDLLMKIDMRINPDNYKQQSHD
jgi:hypothetical protein